LGARVAADLYQTDAAYVAVMDMPGVGADELDLSVSGTTLTVAGQRKPSDPQPDYVRRERLAQRFSRSLQVPGDVDVEQITAKLGNGVLTITLPKGGVGEET
jgi:HSP20 family protein